MPELPEVETVARGLEPAMLGRILAEVVQRRPNLRIPFPPDFVAALTGAGAGGSAGCAAAGRPDAYREENVRDFSSPLAKYKTFIILVYPLLGYRLKQNLLYTFFIFFYTLHDKTLFCKYNTENIS